MRRRLLYTYPYDERPSFLFFCAPDLELSIWLRFRFEPGPVGSAVTRRISTKKQIIAKKAFVACKENQNEAFL